MVEILANVVFQVVDGMMGVSRFFILLNAMMVQLLR